MSLSEDRRALLRLLVGGDDYQQVAELLGTSAQEVRRRAREALDHLEREGDADQELAACRARLAELEEPGTPGLAAPGPITSRWRPALIVTVALGAALAALLVVLLVVAGGGSDSGGEEPAPPADQEDVVEVKLEPVGGSRAKGTARLVRVEDLPALDLEINGLAPTGSGQTYVVWLLGSGRQGLPVAFRDVGPDGELSGRTQVPSAAAGLLPSIEVIDVSLAPQAAVSEAVSRAAEGGTLPLHLGTTVVRGELPG